MASKLRFSLAVCAFSVVLSAVGSVPAADTAQVAGTAPPPEAAAATQPSCTNSTGVAPTAAETADGFGGSVAISGQTAMVGIPLFTTAFIDPGSIVFETGSEFGPTLLYTLTAGQFVLTTTVGTGSPVNTMGITDEYLITGSMFEEFDFQVSGAGIQNLSTLTN